MRKKQFLEELEEALKENNLARDVISNNIKYYDEYITNNVKDGFNEEEVISELGSGRIIAKTIVDADKKGTKSSYYNASYDNTDYSKESSRESEKYTYTYNSNGPKENNGWRSSDGATQTFSLIMGQMNFKTKIKLILGLVVFFAALIVLATFAFKLFMFVIPYVLLLAGLYLVFKIIF